MNTDLQAAIMRVLPYSAVRMRGIWIWRSKRLDYDNRKIWHAVGQLERRGLVTVNYQSGGVCWVRKAEPPTQTAASTEPTP